MNPLEKIINKMNENSTKQINIATKQRRRRNRHKGIVLDFCSLFENSANSYKSKSEMLGALKCRKQLFQKAFKSMFSDGYFMCENPKQKPVKNRPHRYCLTDHYFKVIENKTKPKISWSF